MRFKATVAVASLLGVLLCGVWLSSSALRKRAVAATTFPQTAIKILADDKLTDFVIDRGDFYACPTTREELENAIVRGTAQRTSGFYFSGDKPFFGNIPVSFCYREYRGGLNFGSVSQLQIRKGFEWVNAGLGIPKKPEVLIVAAGSADGAQRAAYSHETPITYPGEQYWAVVYAGTAGSDPTVFVIDRVTINKGSAEIVVYRPPHGSETCDMHPYWFFVPLGQLADGKYSVNVRDANKDEMEASTTNTLRRASKEEQAARNDAAMKDQEEGSKHYDELQQANQESGAALQLRLARITEFIHSANIKSEDRELLSQDVKRLGEAARWDQLGTYFGPQSAQSELDAVKPGEMPGTEVGRNSWDDSPQWKPSDISIHDVWMCDGTDAGWYASKTYRNVPELNGALTSTNPTPIQAKIKGIWNALKQKCDDSRGKILNSFVVAGTIDDAINATYGILVDCKEPQKTFSPDDQMWAVFVARRSFLIRQISTRFNLNIEYFVHASAYISKADGVNDGSPVTFALIPLGRQQPGQSVTVIYAGQSICSRQVGATGPDLLYAKPFDLLLSSFSNGVCYPTGFQVSR
jgi:hypothetical protein